MEKTLNVNTLRPGTTFLKNDKVYLVLESSHAKSGRGQAHVKTKLKNLSDKSIINITFTGGDKVEAAFLTKKNCQFLYFEKQNAIVMDLESFEQTSIPAAVFNDLKDYLVEGCELSLLYFENNLIDIELPKNVVLQVVETADAVRGNTVNAANKKAILNSGLELDVPQFINIDDEIIVSTLTGKYVSRN